MAERNPGNKPKPNDRIPYAYIKLKDRDLYDYNNLYKAGKNKGKPRPKKILQGDRIEHPEFIRIILKHPNMIILKRNLK